MNKFTQIFNHPSVPLIAMTLGSLTLLGFAIYQEEQTSGTLQLAREELASTTSNYEHRLADLSSLLAAEQEKNNAFEEQIKLIAGTVNTLEKLEKTDPQLLQKYSRVYFLNEHYTPARLSNIDEEYLINKNKPLQIHASIEHYLEQLLNEAQEDNVPIKVASAYRSYGTQAVVKHGYDVLYGTGSNTFSADQGYSEHQLGTTVDFTTPTLGADFSAFGSTKAYEWLTENAHKYGFILSYPKGNKFYQYEPWHWRFVGVELAGYLHDEKKSFYDLDQRTINEHLVNIFD